MIILTTSTPYARKKTPSDFYIRVIHRSSDLLGQNLFSILRIEETDSLKLFLSAITRMQARIGQGIVYHPNGWAINIPPGSDLEGLFNLLREEDTK